MSKMEFSTDVTVHDEYDHANPLNGLKNDLMDVKKRQDVLEQKIDRVIDFLDNHEALMLQKINDFLSENRRLFMDTLNDVIDKENSSKHVVDKMNEFLTENRKIYLELFQSVYTQSKKNTNQIKAIKPLLDNINRTQEGISSLLKLSYSTELDSDSSEEPKSKGILPIPSNIFK